MLPHDHAPLCEGLRVGKGSPWGREGLELAGRCTDLVLTWLEAVISWSGIGFSTRRWLVETGLGPDSSKDVFIQSCREALPVSCELESRQASAKP